MLENKTLGTIVHQICSFLLKIENKEIYSCAIIKLYYYANLHLLTGTTLSLQRKFL